MVNAGGEPRRLLATEMGIECGLPAWQPAANLHGLDQRHLADAQSQRWRNFREV
jgi:hypothetical protein